MRTSRSATVYGLLLAVWCAIGLWEIVEHSRVVESSKAALLNRAKDISNSLGVVIRSQHFFISQPRLESALRELAQSGELKSVALLNASGEAVASGGEPIDEDVSELPEKGVRWDADTVTILNLVDLGTNEDVEGATRSTRIVVPAPDESAARVSSGSRERQIEQAPWYLRDASRERREESSEDRVSDASRSISRPADERVASATGERRGRRHRSWNRFEKPPWMTTEKYNELLAKQGLHGFVLVISSSAVREAAARDLWLRFTLSAVALMAIISIGFAWRKMDQSSALQLRLVRASEMNLHLREINVAAAGLAHETRNPLNIVRGLAQMISRQTDISEDTRQRTNEIVKEVDLVTTRLNEFIDYSRPLEAKPAPTAINTVVKDVARALESDMEDKAVQFTLNGPELVVEADESLLRQVIFNLLMNAIQAVSRGGLLEVVVEKTNPREAILEVRDNGHGVPEHSREEIFQPYFTTTEGGTGLGLTVVRQIVLAHGWEIEYIPGEEHGSTFRLSRLKLISKSLPA